MKLHFIAASLAADRWAVCQRPRRRDTHRRSQSRIDAVLLGGRDRRQDCCARPDACNFDRSFSDIISNVDAGFMGLAVVSYNRFVLYADYDYIGLSDDAKTKNGVLVPVGTKVKGELDLAVGTYGGGYRFDTFGKNTIDVLVGAQLTDLEPKVKVLGQHFQNKNNLTDTVVMLRPSFQLSERWRFNPTFAYGVSGDSDTTYTMMPQLQYQFSESFAARFGYKKVHYEFDDNGPNERHRHQWRRSSVWAGRSRRVPEEAVAATSAAGSGCEARSGRCRCTAKADTDDDGVLRYGRPVPEHADRHACRPGGLRLRLRAAHALRVRLGGADRRRQSTTRPARSAAAESEARAS